jgi:hypothetical protein
VTEAAFGRIMCTLLRATKRRNRFTEARDARGLDEVSTMTGLPLS